MLSFIEVDGSSTRINYFSSFLTKEEQDEIIDELFKETFVKFSGRTIEMKWCNKYDISYKFGKTELESSKFPLFCEKLFIKIKLLTGEEYDSVLINKYVDETSKIGWHSDNEDCILEDSTILSLSIGSERNFLIRRMTEKEREKECIITQKVFIKNNKWKHEEHRFLLRSGSLLTMEGSMQKFWYHMVPKSQTKKGVRYNLTFRKYK